ncbi:CDP-glycerol glycerophosphotransferase family protein [Enterococcus casseliflavus]|uniref:CDP-glycerol glycerophosphotransferase family protein n=1 Tax=Enterococcus casseliflavus TaxID=37734 RepID=UPI003D10CF15
MKLIEKIKKNVMTPNELRYLKFRNLPIKKKTILLEGSHGREFSGHIFALTKNILQFYPEYTVKIVTRKNVYLPAEFETYNVEHLSKEYFEYLATAEILINDTSFWSFFNKRVEQQYYIFWHGTPLKFLGKSTQIQGYGNIQRNLASADKVFVSNEFTKKVLISDFGIENIVKNEIVIAPSPRNSYLFDNRVVPKRYLYMPTWRGKNTNNVTISDKLIDNLKRLDDLLHDNEEMFVKLHPYEENLINFDSYNFKHLKKFPKEETYTFMQTVEKIVTDYSSIMFDFLVTKREVLLFTFDEEEYQAERGMYFKIKDLPFKKVTDPESLILALRQNYSFRNDEFIKSYCNSDNENGALQVIDFLLSGKNFSNINVQNNWNGKENVLIYAYQLAENGITASLLNYFETVDLTKRNYILTWQEGMIPEKLEYKIKNLPKGIFTFISAGKVQSTISESFATLSYMNEKPASKKLVEEMYLRDFKRQYPNLAPAYFIHYPGYDRSYASWMWILKKIGIKTIIFVHTDIEKEMELNKYLKRNILFEAYKEATKVICVSETIKKKIDYLVPEANTFVSNVLINKKKVEKLSKLPITDTVPLELIDKFEKKSNKIFINIGRFSKQKGLDRLIKAFETVEDKNVYLVLIESYGPEKETIINKINSSNKKESIYLLQNLGNPYNLLRKASYFIFSSRYEGLGMVVLEALAVNTPVIMTEVPETLEILDGADKTIVVENSIEGLIKGFDLGIKNILPNEKFMFSSYEERALSTWEKIFKD